MKFIIAYLLLAPALVFTQTKGDNTIVIPKIIATSELKTVLFKAGYSVIGADTMFLNTLEKEVPKTTVTMRIMVARIDSATYLKGQWKGSVVMKLFGVESENNFESVVFRGMKNSLYRQAWDELDRV